MIVDTELSLILSQTKAHTVVVRDDFGNALFAAIHFADSIVYARIGDKDFESVLRLIGDLPAPKVVEIPVKK
jgi:hypothetical protein